MPLQVTVVHYKEHPPSKQMNACFNQDGGTIGRSTDRQNNHLALPDPERFISRKHASIKYENGIYTLTDTSTDGTFINNKSTRVHRETVTLADGDQIWIGDYELSIHIISNDTSEPPENSHAWWPEGDPWEGNAEEKGGIDQPEASPLHDAFTPPEIADESDPPREIPQDFDFRELIDDLNEARGAEAEPGFFASGREDSAGDSGTSRPPLKTDPLQPHVDSSQIRRETSPSQAPPLSGVSAASLYSDSPGPDSPEIQQIRRQARNELFQVFLDAAGVKDPRGLQEEDIAERMRIVGVVFREMAQGLMTVLRGRSEVKTQLQLPVTVIKPAENNPLKFFPSAEEAVQQLLTGNQPGFVDAIKAVREGFSDVMNHQLAITAGVQAAAIKLIERFDPQNIAEQFDEGAVFQKKAKTWDKYRQAYSEIAEEALETFFGKSFARAYEAQIRQLQSKSNDRQDNQ